MADQEKLPPLNADSSLDMILLVQLANTLADLGVFGWFMWSHCPTHGEQQEPAFDENPPTQAAIQCRRCYREGLQRYCRIEDITRF